MVEGKIERKAGRGIDQELDYETDRKRYSKERLQKSESNNVVDSEE